VLVDQLTLIVFDGFNDITFNVNQATNWFVIHNGIGDYLTLTKFLDKDGNPVNVTCYAIFTLSRFDYFILKTSQTLTPASSPYTIEFLFVNPYTGQDNG
jgi:hypothetical protein